MSTFRVISGEKRQGVLQCKDIEHGTFVLRGNYNETLLSISKCSIYFIMLFSLTFICFLWKRERKREKMVNELGFLCICLCFCAVGFVVLRSTHRIEDVNVNTVSQRKGMCEARKKPWGQSPKEEGRGEERKEGGGKWNREKDSG